MWNVVECVYFLVCVLISFSLGCCQDEHFSPVAISLLQTAYPLVIAGFMKITERLAKPLGRPQPVGSLMSTSLGYDEFWEFHGILGYLRHMLLYIFNYKESWVRQDERKSQLKPEKHV